MTELPIADSGKDKVEKKHIALFVKIEESLNLRNPKIKNAPRFLKKQAADRKCFK